MPHRAKLMPRRGAFHLNSQLYGGGIQYGGYIAPFKGSSYQYGGYINPYAGSSYQYGTGVGFYRRQAGAGFLDVVKGIFRFLMPIVAPAAMHAGTTFLGNLTKGVDEGKSFKDSAKEALMPSLQSAIETGKERFLAGQKKEGGGRRKRRGASVYKGGEKKRKLMSVGGSRKKSRRKHSRVAKTRAKKNFKNFLKSIKRKHRGENKNNNLSDNF